MEITSLQKWIADKIGVPNEDLTRNRIYAYQLERIQETIDWVRANSSFYRRHLAGLGEGNIVSLEDFTRLPFTTAADIKHNSLQFLCVSQSEISRVVTLQTSGTTGEPKRFYFTEADQETITDFFHHAAYTFLKPGDRVLILFPGEHPGSIGDIALKALSRLGAVGVPHGLVRNPGQTMDIIRREGINSLWGIPVQVLGLARYRDAAGQAVPTQIKTVMLSTDNVPRAIIKELEQTWGCSVYQHYGTTEMGWGAALECQALTGYHLRELDLYFEIINPETGLTVPAGETGEVVVTTLTRRGMPLIRYRTGDLTRFIPELCPCGAILKRMAPVMGRLDSKVIISTGSAITMSQLDEVLFPIEGLLDFAPTVTGENGLNTLQVKVNLAPWAHREALHQVLATLEAIPAIASARQAGALKVLATLTPEPLFRGKRTITDLRNTEASLDDRNI